MGRTAWGSPSFRLRESSVGSVPSVRTPQLPSSGVGLLRPELPAFLGATGKYWSSLSREVPSLQLEAPLMEEDRKAQDTALLSGAGKTKGREVAGRGSWTQD